LKRHKTIGEVMGQENCSVCGATRAWRKGKPDGRWSTGQFCPDAPYLVSDGPAIPADRVFTVEEVDEIEYALDMMFGPKYWQPGLPGRPEDYAR
jgi:hypothetical protein